MNLDKYTELTGITVTDEALVTAQIARTKAILETMLGFTLSSNQAQENLYNELGKTALECACPSVDTEDLEPPDDVEGAYRLYSYNELDKYFHVDPFTTLYKVKLVFNRPGSGDQGVTIKTFDNDEVRVHMKRGTWSKFIEHCIDCFCLCSCSDCVQLAVDADWLFDECLPSELLYVWADMITYYADCNKDIKSESILTHSYTKFDRTAPEEESQYLKIIKRYAGPFGSVSGMPI